MIETGTYKIRRSIAGLFLRKVVQASELAYVDIISVHVEGMTFEIKTSGTPANMEVVYTKSAGRLTFPIDIETGLSVFVMYQS